MGNNYIGGNDVVPGAKYLFEALMNRFSKSGREQANLDWLVEKGAPNRMLTLANRYMAEQRKSNITPPKFKHKYGGLIQGGTALASADYDDY